MRIVVIKLRHIGDVLLTSPVFNTLKKNFPDSEIFALVNKGTEEVLTGHCAIDEIIVFDRGIKNLSLMKKNLKELDFLKFIRHKKFDMTIDLTGGDRASVISFISGAKYRIGAEAAGFFGKRYFYSKRVKIDGSKHVVLQNLEILKEALDIENLDYSVNFFIPEKDRAFVNEILMKHKIDKEEKIVHVHPTSRWLFKCGKDEYMAEVINWLLKNGLVVIVTSSPEERELNKAKKILSMVKNSKNLIDLCGKTTIKQLGAISEKAHLFFGVDSAPMHIAASVGTPVLALFGPSGAFNWGPWDNNAISKEKPYPERNGIQHFGIHTVIQRNWQCIPCGQDGCNGSKISNCLFDITPDEMIEILKIKLQLC